MSGAEAVPPPPPPPRHGAPHGAPQNGYFWKNPWRGEFHQYSHGPNGQHYYTYVTKYRRCGGRWGTGFVVGGLVGAWAATCWQRKQHCHEGDNSCWTRGPWGMNRNDNNQKPSKPENITNQ